jgi:hypothetical protein
MVEAVVDDNQRGTPCLTTLIEGDDDVDKNARGMSARSAPLFNTERNAGFAAIMVVV